MKKKQQQPNIFFSSFLGHIGKHQTFEEERKIVLVMKQWHIIITVEDHPFHHPVTSQFQPLLLNKYTLEPSSKPHTIKKENGCSIQNKQMVK